MRGGKRRVEEETEKGKRRVEEETKGKIKEGLRRR